MIEVLLYDGSFDGLMTSVYEAFHMRTKEIEIYKADAYTPSLLEETRLIATDYEKAGRVNDSIEKKLGTSVYECVLYAFFSDEGTAGTVIYRFLKAAYKIGPKCLEYRAHKDIGPLLDLYRRVSRESHHLLGLTRFSELESDILYAQYESDTFVLHILAAHFLNRLTGEKWVLHDVGRSVAAICDGQQWTVNPVEIPENIRYHEREKAFQNLWKTYFRHIAIEARINPDLQQKNMPKKYWKYLTEKTR